MKVYLDLVFFINFILDYFILLTVKIILKRNIKFIRILFGGFVGALSTFLLLYNLDSLLLFILKVIISIFMLIVTFGIKDKEYNLKNFLYLYLVSIILGGFLYFIKLEVSYNSIIIVLLLSPIILYLYIKQAKELKIDNRYTYTVSFLYNRKKYTYSAYLDTGNKLYDPYSHNPVLILYDKNINIKNPIYIPYNTVESTGVLKAFKLNKIIIDNKEIKKKVIIALSDKPFKMNGVDMLLNKEYLG